MQIVFMPMLPLTLRDYEMLGIKYFHEKNYKVTVVESHQLFIPGYKENVNLQYYHYENTYEPTSTKQLLDFVSKFTESDYIFYYLATSEAVSVLNKMKNN